MSDAWDACLAQINALSEDERVMMGLRFEHGLDINEIAEVLKRDPDDVARTLSRAVATCQPELV